MLFRTGKNGSSGRGIALGILVPVRFKGGKFFRTLHPVGNQKMGHVTSGFLGIKADNFIFPVLFIKKGWGNNFPFNFGILDCFKIFLGSQVNHQARFIFLEITVDRID